jgi:serine/threonine protein kinase
LGVLLYYCITTHLPFNIKAPGDWNKLSKLRLTFPSEISTECRNVLVGLLKIDPRERLSIPELLCHKWIKANCQKDEVLFGRKECQQEDAGEGINEINVGNIFPEGREVKIAHTDYCCITNDFLSFHQDVKAIKETEELGYAKSYLLKSLQNGSMNHATATYSLLSEK